jgi:putative aldouronate transport system permease protein
VRRTLLKPRERRVTVLPDTQRPLGQDLVAKRQRFFRILSKKKYLYLMMIPVLAWYIIFAYLPMYGIVLAFQDFKFSMGFTSPFVGFANFIKLFGDKRFMEAFRNTIVLNLLRFVFGVPAPVIFALLLNELYHSGVKRLVQTVTYLPHFISWVALAGIINTLLAKDSGAVNLILMRLGFEQVGFLIDNRYFRGVLVATDLWKETGWSSIIYLASIAGISPSLYECATVEGASRLQMTWHITIPCISNTIAIMAIIFLGHILSIGFDQIFNMYNPVVYETADILDTYIVRNLQMNPKFGLLSAASFVKSVVGLSLLILANNVVKWFGLEGIYSAREAS